MLVNLLDEWSARLRQGDATGAAELEARLMREARPAGILLIRQGEAAAAAGRHDEALRRFEAAAEFLPGEPGLVRATVNACFESGDPDGAVRRLLAFDPLSAGPIHLTWAVATLCRCGRFAEAQALLDAAQGREDLPRNQLQVTEALLCLEMGLDIESARILAQLQEEGALTVDGVRLAARLHRQRGEQAEQAALLGQIALHTGAPGDLEAALEPLEPFMRYAPAIDIAERFLAAHPARADAVNPVIARLRQGEAELREALAAHGPLEAATAQEVTALLRGGGLSSTRLRWARAAMVAICDRRDFPPGMIAEFMRPFSSWEDGRLPIFILHALRQTFPGHPALAEQHFRRLSQNPTHRQGLLEGLAALAPGQMSEDLLVIAIHLLRGIAGCTGREEAAYAAPAAALRAGIAARLPTASAGLRAFAGAHLRRLGLEAAAPAAAAEAQPALGFVEAPWRGRPWGGTVVRRQRAASPVIALSGQMRGFDRALPTMARHLFPLGVPVLASLWDTSRNALGRHAQRLERTLPADLLARIPPLERYTDSFQANFPRSFELVFGAVPVRPEAIAAKLAAAGAAEHAVEVESEAAYDAAVTPNQAISSTALCKMFARFHRMEAMIREVEEARGETFTHVIWLRPDAAIRRLARSEVDAWLAEREAGFGEAVRANTVGDYMLALPRAAFAALGRVFPAAMLRGDVDFCGFYPVAWGQLDRRDGPGRLGGPEGLAAALFAGGFLLHQIRTLRVELMGYIPEDAALRATFEDELAARTAA